MTVAPPLRTKKTPQRDPSNGAICSKRAVPPGHGRSTASTLLAASIMMMPSDDAQNVFNRHLLSDRLPFREADPGSARLLQHHCPANGSSSQKSQHNCSTSTCLPLTRSTADNAVVDESIVHPVKELQELIGDLRSGNEVSLAPVGVAVGSFAGELLGNLIVFRL